MTKEFFATLSRIFRHVLPGLIVLGASHEAYPSWFPWVSVKSTSHLVVLGAVAVAIGNVWYSFHRFGIQQLIDFVLYMFQFPGPAGPPRRQDAFGRYHDDVAQHVVDTFRSVVDQPWLREHVEFRASTVALMYIVVEVTLAGVWWHEPSSVFSGHRSSFLALAFIGFVVATWQNVIVSPPCQDS